MIFIDGDGSPVIKITAAIAKKHNIPVTVVADIHHNIAVEGVEKVTVDHGPDSADFAIVQRMNAGDLVVTSDMGLSSLVLGKGGHVLTPMGKRIDQSNIDTLLMMRHIHQEMRRAKKRHKGPKKRPSDADEFYEEMLEKVISDLSLQ